MSDYLVPVNADVPALDATYLPAEDTIADPLGRRVTDLPITLEKLL
jgi:xanthine dehydrogenase YagR molybdenum-binding subunit